MHGELSVGQMDALRGCLLRNLYDVSLQKESYELSCNVDDNLKYLLDYLELRKKRNWMDTPALFQLNRRSGVRIKERLVNTELRKIKAAIGLNKKLTCHVFRKTLASELHRKGLDPISISKLLGYESVSTSEKYYINVNIDIYTTNSTKLFDERCYITYVI